MPVFQYYQAHVSANLILIILALICFGIIAGLIWFYPLKKSQNQAGKRRDRQTVNFELEQAVPRKASPTKAQRPDRPGSNRPDLAAPENLDYPDYICLSKMREDHTQFGVVDSKTEYVTKRNNVEVGPLSEISDDNTVPAHPEMIDKPYFSGIDESDNPAASENPSARSEMEKQHRLQNMPVFNPKPRNVD